MSTSSLVTTSPPIPCLQDGVPVSDFFIPHLYEAEDPAEVTIQMASPEMAGTYTCVAENAAGTATRDTLFSVIGQSVYAHSCYHSSHLHCNSLLLLSRTYT